MKTRLNILCILIFAAIFASVADSISTGIHDFMWGFERGSKEGLRDTSLSGDSFLWLMPNTTGTYSDSIYNEKTATWLPMQYRNVVVEIKENMYSMGETAVIFISVFIQIFLVLFQIIVFCKLIYAINQSKIFEWSNVLKLRLIGGAMIATFLLNALYYYISYSAQVEAIDISGYTIVADELWSFYQLIPGLGVLLMGEVFAIGLRLREEQELTI